jgi:hypothetical protein
MPVGCLCVGADTRESSLLFDTPTACLRPSGSEVKMKPLSREHPVAMAGLFRFAAAAPRNGASPRSVRLPALAKVAPLLDWLRVAG